MTRRRKEFGKVARDLEVGDVFEIGGQPVQVVMRDEILAHPASGSEQIDVSMVVTRIGAQNQIANMMFICSEHTPITTIQIPQE